MHLRYWHNNQAGVYVLTPDVATTLWTLNINKSASGATVTVYNGQTSFGNSEIIATVDGGTVASKAYGVLANHGITVVIAGGAPDVTVGYP